MKFGVISSKFTNLRISDKKEDAPKSIIKSPRSINICVRWRQAVKRYVYCFLWLTLSDLRRHEDDINSLWDVEGRKEQRRRELGRALEERLGFTPEKGSRPPATASIYCENCKIKSSSEYRAKRHIFGHSSRKQFACHQCTRSFCLRKGLLEHVQRTHNFNNSIFDAESDAVVDSKISPENT